MRYGWLRWPRIHISLTDIVSASAIKVDRQTARLRWTTRLSLRPRVMVIRSGPALRLDLANGEIFVLGVDDAQTAASVLATELARRSGEAGASASGERRNPGIARVDATE